MDYEGRGEDVVDGDGQADQLGTPSSSEALQQAIVAATSDDVDMPLAAGGSTPSASAAPGIPAASSARNRRSVSRSRTAADASGTPADGVYASGTPTVILQPRSARKPGSVAARLHAANLAAEEAEEEAAQGQQHQDDESDGMVVMFGGVSTEVAGVTPAAVRRSRRLGILTTPNTASQAAATMPRTASKSVSMRTPAATPAGHAAGIQAPAPTPLPMAQLQGPSNSPAGAAVSEVAAVAEQVQAAPAATRTKAAAPATAAATRRSARVATTVSQTTASKTMTGMRQRGAGLGHVVSPDGFLHERSPKGKVIAAMVAAQQQQEAAAAAASNDEKDDMAVDSNIQWV